MTDKPSWEFNPSPRSWFLRGCVVGILLCAAMNAASYFFRSTNGGNLLGTSPCLREALGFPSELWEEGNSYGGWYLDYGALGINALFAAGVALLFGYGAVRLREPMNQKIRAWERRESLAQKNFQFTLRGLMVLTTIVATSAAIAKRWQVARPEALGAIYLLGPTVLVLIALVPYRIPWQQRVYVLLPLAGLLIAAAINIGANLQSPLPFDKVLLGIFVCWTPQSVLAACGLSAALFLVGDRKTS